MKTDKGTPPLGRGQRGGGPPSFILPQWGKYLPLSETTFKFLRFIRRQTLDGAGEKFFGNPGRKSLIVSEENEIWLDGSDRDKKILRITENTVYGREFLLQNSLSFSFGLVREVTFETQNIAITRNNHEDISTHESLFQDKAMTGVQPIEGPKNEDTHTSDVITS